MDNLRKQTIDVYNQNAGAMAEKFRNIPPRVSDIELAFELAGNPEHPRVIEIGCGDGRDAKEIVRKADYYLGIDASEGLIELARQHVPEAKFEVADAVEYEYPENIDVVFAFASFLHFSKSETKQVFKKLKESLRSGGVIYLSLKWAPEYKVETNEDRFGVRQYYFYNENLIKALAGEAFEIVHSRGETRKNANHADWLELILRRSSSGKG